jgi:hypothetical protein
VPEQGSEKISVEITTLDEWMVHLPQSLAPESIDVLKIDAEGSAPLRQLLHKVKG